MKRAWFSHLAQSPFDKTNERAKCWGLLVHDESAFPLPARSSSYQKASTVRYICIASSIFNICTSFYRDLYRTLYIYCLYIIQNTV